MKEARVKATPVNALAQFVSSDLTAEQLQRVLDELTPEERRYFTGHVLAHDLVPLEPVNRFTVLAARAKGEPVQIFARRAGRYGAEMGIRSVYRFVLMVLSPEAVLRKAPLMWSRVYDSGDLQIESTATSARIHLRNFPSHEAGCGRITGWLETLGQKSGAKDLRLMHTACMAEGDDECLWELQWRE